VKVRCIKIINEHNGKEQGTNEWLTVGKDYIVLAIEIYPTKNLYLIVDDSNQIPGLHDAKQFEILSHKIPSNWIINPGDLEILTISPEAWQKPTFWEECYEGNLSTIEIYKREVRIIYEEESEY
jgi:hypothetical protein